MFGSCSNLWCKLNVRFANVWLVPMLKLWCKPLREMNQRKGNIGVSDEMKTLKTHTHKHLFFFQHWLETHHCSKHICLYIVSVDWKCSSFLEFHILIKYDETLTDLLPKKIKDVLCFTWTWEGSKRMEPLKWLQII